MMDHLILLKSDCINWHDNNSLHLNKKGKEFIFDFRKCNPSYTPITIGESPVERVEKFRDLTTFIDDR